MGENAKVAGWVRLYDGNNPVEEFSHGPEKPREWRDEDCARVVFHADHERSVAQHERIVAGLEARLREAEDWVLELRDYVVNERDQQLLPRKRKGIQAELDRIDAFLAQTADGVMATCACTGPLTGDHLCPCRRAAENARQGGQQFERISPPATSEEDHYYVCPHCGESVDMRQLAQVMYHERDGHGRMGREG